MGAANALFVKEMNRKAVRRAFFAVREATKRELADRTGLSLMTVGSAVADMVAQGELRVSGQVASEGGRPSALYAYEGGYCRAAILCGYQQGSLNVLRVRVLSALNDALYDAQSARADIRLEDIEAVLDEAIARTGPVCAIVMALPGVMLGGTVALHDYTALIGVRLIERVEQRYGTAARFVNDVNAAALGHWRRGAQGMAAGVYFPRLFGPGMGLVLDGAIYEGEAGFAGEVGHLPLGIRWDELDYGCAREKNEAIARLLSMVCAIVAPESIALYGDFFAPEDAHDIACRTHALLRGHFMPKVTVADSIARDMLTGLGAMAMRDMRRLAFHMEEDVT